MPFRAGIEYRLLPQPASFLPAARAWARWQATSECRSRNRRAREHDGRVFLDSDFRERLQIPQLDAGRSVDSRCAASTSRWAAENSPSAWMIFERFSRSARPAWPWPAAWTRHVHLLDFHVGHLHAPGRGVRIEDALQPQINLVAVRQQFVEFLFANTERSVVCANCEVW